MIIFDNIYIEFYIIIVILAIIFYLFRNIDVSKLVLIIIILMLSYGFYLYLMKLSDDKKNMVLSKENTIDSDIINRADIADTNFYIKNFPKKLIYLKRNEEFMNIIFNIRFIKKFSKSRYSDLLLNLDKLMKIYIYILADRYNGYHYLPIFVDIRNNILELLYSLIIIIPAKLKHTYGFDSYTEITKSTEDFIAQSRNMIEVLEAYSKIEKKIPYLHDTKYQAYNFSKSLNSLP